MNNFYNNKHTFRLLIVFLIFIFGKNGFAQTSITGKVIDKDTGEEMIAANIMVTKSGNFIQGARTDIDGNYNVKLDPGTYDVEVSYTGYPTVKITDVIIIENQFTKLNISLELGQYHFGCGGVVGYKIPIIKQDETSTGQTITTEKIRLLPTRNINQIITITPGVSFTQ